MSNSTEKNFAGKRSGFFPCPQNSLCLFFSLLLMLLFSLSGCAQNTAAEVEQSLTKPAEPLVWQTDRGRHDIAARIVQQMTTEEKVGQMLLTGIGGTSLPPREESFLQQHYIGGIIFFDRNMQSREQVRALIRHLQETEKNRFHLPLFIAIDQEGGAVTRMDHILFKAPPAAQVAASGDSRKAYEYALRTGREIKELGFNLNFAPVLDISSRMDGRSYGKTAEQAAAFSLEACRGFRDSGVLFTLKHFPGMGKSATDPHQTTAVVTASREQLLQEDLLPFRNALAVLPEDKLLIMAGHIRYPALDKEPASLSSAIITGLLRQEMGYRGLVITDDLDMGAVSKVYPPEIIGIKAVQAGADILLSCSLPDVQRKIYESLIAALKNGTLAQSSVDAAVERIVYIKITNLMPEEIVKQLYTQLQK